MSWMNNLTLLVLTNAIAGTLAYGLWWIFARVLKGMRLFDAGYRLFRVMLLFWALPLNFFLIEMYYYKKDGAWYGLPYHADMYVPLLNVLTAVWLAGVIIGGIKAGLAAWRLRHIPLSRQRSSVSMAGKMANAMAFDAWAKDNNGNLQLYPGFNWGEDIRVYCAPVPVPAACAGLHPKIYLPPFNYKPEDLQVIVAHEVTHILRGDLKIRYCLLALKVIFWFHPLSGQLFNDFEYWSEISCDIDVCYSGKIAVRPKKYMQLLLRISEEASVFQGDAPYVRKYFMSGLNPQVKQLKERFDNILSFRSRRFSRLVTVALLGIFVGLGLAMTLAGGGLTERAVAAGVHQEHVAKRTAPDMTVYSVNDYVGDGKVRPWDTANIPQTANSFYEYFDIDRFGDDEAIYWFMGQVEAGSCGGICRLRMNVRQTVTLYTELSMRQAGVRVGLYYPDGTFHYICQEEAVYGQFDIEEAGVYILAIENESDHPVRISGSFMYVPYRPATPAEE